MQLQRWTTHFLLCLILISCAAERPKGRTQAEVLYKEALQFVESERYLLATERLNLLRSQHPYSYYSTHAELLQADILFLQESFVEAAAAYQLFRDLHPKHPKSAYVVWRLAESFFSQVPSTFDRDLTSAKNAISIYRQLLAAHPKSEFVKGAQEKIQKCLTMLKDKEQYIADFYFKTKEYGAALFRYEGILKTQKDGKLLAHARIRSIESAFKAEKFQRCLDLYGRHKDELSSQAQKKATSVKGDCEKALREAKPSEGEES